MAHGAARHPQITSCRHARSHPAGRSLLIGWIAAFGGYRIGNVGYRTDMFVMGKYPLFKMKRGGTEMIRSHNG